MNLVHRDFTPSNIMITYAGTVKVIDFGVARVQDNSQRHETRIGSIKGKISYLSPEQCMATPIDRRSDVFAAGIVLWELLSRRRLFDGPSDAAIIVSIMKDDIPLPGWQGQPVDWDLQDIIMKALQRDPNHRYQTAAAMRADLREYLRNKQEKVDAADISVVMNQLFEQERISDEKLAAAGRDPSKATPLPRDRSRSGNSQPGSRSGQSKSGQSRSGTGVTSGSARGEQVVVPPGRSKTPIIVIGGGVMAALLGVGVWKFTRPAPEPPKPPEQVYNHPPQLPKNPDPPKDPDPPKQPQNNDPPKQPEVAHVDPPKQPEQPKQPKQHHEPKETAPSGGYGMLDFDTRPYTEVFIGKKKIGDTPLLGAKVPAGNIKLTLINNEAGVHETFEITIPKDGHVSKKLKL
jgi:serine/threonine-protein kinase